MFKDLAAQRARGEAELAALREIVDRDRAAVDDEKAKLKAAMPSFDERVQLNVGGVRYESSRSMLTRFEDTMLGRMFGRCDLMLQADPDDGSVFIDRDGGRFGLILDFLRDGDASNVAATIRGLPEVQRQAMVHELDFFGLEAAVFGVAPWFEGAAFSTGPEMNTVLHWCGAVHSGRRVFAFGGRGGSINFSLTAVLDLDSMVFTAGPDMLSARVALSAIAIDARRVLVVGGSSQGHCLNTTEIMDLETLTFSAGPIMQSERASAAVVALDARRILVVGGENEDGALATTEVMDLDTMAFTPGPDLLSPRDGCAAVRLDARRCLVVGGHDGRSNMYSTEVLDIATMTFTAGPLVGSQRNGCAVV